MLGPKAGKQNLTSQVVYQDLVNIGHNPPNDPFGYVVFQSMTVPTSIGTAALDLPPVAPTFRVWREQFNDDAMTAALNTPYSQRKVGALFDPQRGTNPLIYCSSKRDPTCSYDYVLERLQDTRPCVPSGWCGGTQVSAVIRRAQQLQIGLTYEPTQDDDELQRR